MSHIIIKVSPDVDRYVEWSTVLDGPTAIGTRADMLREIMATNDQPAGDIEKRLRRADMTGTSAVGTFELFGSWSDTGFVVENRGWLPRAKLGEFLDLYDLDEDDNSAAYRLLEPLAE